MYNVFNANATTIIIIWYYWNSLFPAPLKIYWKDENEHFIEACFRSILVCFYSGAMRMDFVNKWLKMKQERVKLYDVKLFSLPNSHIRAHVTIRFILAMKSPFRIDRLCDKQELKRITCIFIEFLRIRCICTCFTLSIDWITSVCFVEWI